MSPTALPLRVWATARGSLLAYRVADDGRLALEARCDLPGDPLALAVRGDRAWVVTGEQVGLLIEAKLEAGSMGTVSVTESGGSLPCSVAVSHDGASIAVAHYGQGSEAGGIAVFASDGSVGPTRLASGVVAARPGLHERQTESHPHHVAFEDYRLRVVDLGTDRVTFHEDPRDLSRGVSIDLPRASGARWSVRTGRRVHVLGELDATVMTVDPAASAPTIVHLPARDPLLAYPSEIVTNEGWVLVARRDGTVDLFSDPASGPLKLRQSVAVPVWPQSLVCCGGMVYVACRDADVIAALRLEGGGLIRVAEADTSMTAPLALAVEG